MGASISSIDTAIVIGYFALVLIIGILIARKTKTSEDLFLGGRTFGWGLIGLSLFASNISSSTIIGLTGAAYKTGIVDSVYEWMSGLPLIIAALFFVPIYLKNKITTIPEFLEKRFDGRSQLFFSGVTIFSTIMIETAGGLYAGVIVIKAFYPDIVMWQAAMGLALIAGMYTALGGLKAVVYTDAIQAIILIVGCAALTWQLYGMLDYDWSKVVASAPENHFSVVRPLDDEAIPWPGLIMGVPFLGFWYWSTNQYIIQRVLGARDLKQARWGVIFAGFLKIIPLFIMVIPGAMAISLFPSIEIKDQVFPFLVTEVLPVGLIGLVLAGLISAILSSVDSALNSSSTLVIIDFVQKFKKDLTQEEMVRYGRIATFVFMIIAAAWAPQIAHFSGLWGYLQQMFSIIVPPIAVIFLAGIFFKRGNAQGSFYTLLLGTIAGIVMFYLRVQGIYELHFTMTVGLMVLLSTVVFIGVSLATPPPPLSSIENLVYDRADITAGFEEVPWYKNYLYQLTFLAILIFSILIWLW